MNRQEALTLIRAHAETVEPPIPCLSCVQAVFPRVKDRSGGPDWRPGLRFSDVHRAWWLKFGAWEDSGARRSKDKPPPIPKSSLYVPCETCRETGILKQGEGPWHDALATMKKNEPSPTPSSSRGALPAAWQSCVPYMRSMHESVGEHGLTQAFLVVMMEKGTRAKITLTHPRPARRGKP